MKKKMAGLLTPNIEEKVIGTAIRIELVLIIREPILIFRIVTAI